MTNGRKTQLVRRSATANSRAFTLIELLLVLMILSVLAGLVYPHFTKRSEQAKITAAGTEISSIATALKMFESDCSRFPTTEEGLNALVQQPSNTPDWHRTLEKGVPKDPWGNAYQYACPGQHDNDYDLWSYGPNGQPGGGDDIDNWTQK